MKTKVVGSYCCGWAKVNLSLRDGVGGELYVPPDSGDCPLVCIGGDVNNWSEIVETALHEIFEYFSARAGKRFYPDTNGSNDISGFFFMFNHSEYADIISKCSEFLSQCIPDLQSGWGVWKKERAQQEAKKKKK